MACGTEQVVWLLFVARINYISELPFWAFIVGTSQQDIGVLLTTGLL